MLIYLLVALSFQVMNEDEKAVIKDLKKCNFHDINEHFKRVSEARKARSKEEKKVSIFIIQFTG